MVKLNGLKNENVKNGSILICWTITIISLIISTQTLTEFNSVIKNVEDTSQTLLIDSLQLEIMKIGSELDSMYIKYN